MVLAPVMVVVINYGGCVEVVALIVLGFWHELCGGSDCWNFGTGCVVGWALVM